MVVNRVLLSLSLATIMALSLLPFVHFAPNRFLGGQGQTLINLFKTASPTLLTGLVLLFFSLLMLCFIAWRWQSHTKVVAVVACLACFALLLIFALLSHLSEQLIAQASPAARVSIGSGFWLAFLLLNLILLDTWQRLSSGRKWFLLLLAAVGLIAVAAFFAQAFDALSLVKEYRNHHVRFAQALYQHIELVLLAFIPTLILGVLLGWLAWRYARGNSLFFSVLNFLQTIPSIALFALLMMPLSWLAINYPTLQTWGISGIGAAPSVIALVLYTLLPLCRNTYEGFAGVPTDTLEAAQGMGMSKQQIFRHIQLPLSLPMILSGVRIVVVQLIGLTVVAALIGAGGLGIFVWEGLGQYALDLVLLGALPTIVLALLADWVLQALIQHLQAVKPSSLGQRQKEKTYD